MRLKVLKVQITKIYLFSILHANFKTYPLQLFIQRSLKLTTEHFLCCWMYVCLGGGVVVFFKIRIVPDYEEKEYQNLQWQT